MWNIIPWPGFKAGAPALGAQSLSYWTPVKSSPPPHSVGCLFILLIVFSDAQMFFCLFVSEKSLLFWLRDKLRIHLPLFQVTVMLTSLLWNTELFFLQKIWNASRICLSSLHRGHANLLCIIPILVYVLLKWARTNVLNFDQVQFINFFCCLCFCCQVPSHCQIQCHENFPYVFF